MILSIIKNGIINTSKELAGSVVTESFKTRMVAAWSNATIEAWNEMTASEKKAFIESEEKDIQLAEKKIAEKKAAIEELKKAM